MQMRGSVAALLLGCALNAAAAEWQGTLEWAQPLTLATTQSGTVEKVSAKAGQRIRRGEELLRLEQSVQRARVAQQKAQVAYTALLLAEAEKERDRSEELYARTLLSDHDLNAARVAYAEANSRYLQAKAAQAEAELQLRDTVIRAPYDAVVLASHVAEGESVNGVWQRQPLYTITPSERLAVRFRLALADSARLQPGMAVSVKSASGRYQGTVEQVTREVQSDAALVEVVIAADSGLVVGMPATVILP